MLILEKRSPIFSDLKFVLKARGKDKAKPIFNKVQIEDGYECKMVVCSDAHRLHLLHDHTGMFEGMKNGQYDVIKSDASQIVLSYSVEQDQYPNIKQIIPKAEEFRADLLEVI